jgi:hypothetical protein
MKKKAVARISSLLALVLWAVASPAGAQQQKQAPITGDILVRQEWNDDFFTTPDPVPSSRTLFQIRPRFEVETNTLRMGVGADINYSTKNNLEPEGIPLPLTLIRDNYDSRSIRLDLAYLGLNLSSAIKLDAGRMKMPFRLTDMIWDRDLRIQGGSLVWTLFQGPTVEPTVRASGVYSRGSHAFADSKDPDGSSLGEGVTMTGGSLDVGFGSAKRLDLSGSYLDFDDLQFLEPKIRRQNTRVAGLLVKEYGVIDIALRLRTESPIPIQLVADWAHNHKTPTQNNGFWASVVLGSLSGTKYRADYTYAKVDKDVTVAAYAGDDFFWGTGWLGHRAELAFAQSPKASFHVIGQMQQFKDSPNLAERSNWLKRFRLEARTNF